MAFNVHSLQSAASTASPAAGKKSVQAKGVQGRTEEGDTFTQSPEAMAMKGGSGGSSTLDKVKRDNAAAVDGMKSAKGVSKADAELHSAIQKALGKSKDTKTDGSDPAKAQAGASAASTAKASTGGSSTLDKVKRDNAAAVDDMKSTRGRSKADEELHASIQNALDKSKKVDAYSAAKTATTASTKSTINVLA